MKISDLTCNDGITTIEQCNNKIKTWDANVIGISHEQHNHQIYYASDYDANGNMVSDPKTAQEVTV